MVMGRDYIYAVSRIRALQSALVTRQEFYSWSEKPLDEVYALVCGVLGLEVLVPVNVFYVDGGIQERFCRVLDDIGFMVGNDPVFELFRLKRDCFNLKLLLARQLAGRDISVPFLDGGVVAPSLLEKAVSGLRYGLPSPMVEAIERVETEFADEAAEADVDVINSIVDEVMWNYALTVSKDCSRIVYDFFASAVDIENICATLRCKALMLGADRFERLLLSGGFLGRDYFVRIYPATIGEIIESFMGTIYASVVSAISSEGGKVSFEFFGRAMDDYLLSRLRPASYKAFGIEPVIAYLKQKEAELKNLRSLVVGKKCGMDSEDIKGLMRDCNG